MRIVRHIGHCPPDAKGAVIALGNFDGVHPGHRAVLARTREIAKEQGTKSGVMTFQPHPREFFKPEQAPLVIYRLAAKLELLRQEGIDLVYLAHFNAAFSQLSAEAFVREVLAGSLGVKHVVTGENFIFGHKRSGNAGFLAAEGTRQGFGNTQVAVVPEAAGMLYASSRIREHLKRGEVSEASRLLGRVYAISGHVRHGDGRGSKIGFPTANIAMSTILHPAYGVYAARVHVGGKKYNAVANLGTRPTVGGTTPLLEVHCFDFSGDLYGKKLEVQLLQYLRPEQKFDNVEQLKAQIARDAESARLICAQQKA